MNMSGVSWCTDIGAVVELFADGMLRPVDNVNMLRVSGRILSRSWAKTDIKKRGHIHDKTVQGDRIKTEYCKDRSHHSVLELQDNRYKWIYWSFVHIRGSRVLTSTFYEIVSRFMVTAMACCGISVALLVCSGSQDKKDCRASHPRPSDNICILHELAAVLVWSWFSILKRSHSSKSNIQACGISCGMQSWVVAIS